MVLHRGRYVLCSFSSGFEDFTSPQYEIGWQTQTLSLFHPIPGEDAPGDTRTGIGFSRIRAPEPFERPDSPFAFFVITICHRVN